MVMCSLINCRTDLVERTHRLINFVIFFKTQDRVTGESYYVMYKRINDSLYR